MNIFVTSPDPRKCARFLDDKRVVKMALETAQLLCTAIVHHGGTAPYKPTHHNHPCTVWTRSTSGNFRWTLDYLVALCWEYSARFGKRHKCQDVVLALVPQMHVIPEGVRTSFVNCTEYKGVDDTHAAYQACLHDKWEADKRRPKWYGRSAPCVGTKN